MNIEEEIKNCEICLKQIKQYDPDPFYVDHFLNKYIISIKRVKDKKNRRGKYRFWIIYFR